MDGNDDPNGRVSELQLKAKEIEHKNIEKIIKMTEISKNSHLSPTSPNRKLAQQIKYFKDPRLTLKVKKNPNSLPGSRKGTSNIIADLTGTANDGNYQPMMPHHGMNMKMPKKSFRLKKSSMQ
jgi:hypothetical protein